MFIIKVIKNQCFVPSIMKINKNKGYALHPMPFKYSKPFSNISQTQKEIFIFVDLPTFSQIVSKTTPTV